MQDESKEIKVPIKTLVEQSMMSNGAKYKDEEIMFLRKYFIACLNLGFLKPNDLAVMINKFTSKIKLIANSYNNINKMDCYVINNGVLYINGSFEYNNSLFYEMNFYKAISEVVFNSNDKHISISNALCEMTAEKIYNMDTNESRIIMPRQDEDMLGNDKIIVRAGYNNYNLTISLLKQLFICLNLNENKLIKEIFFEGFDVVISRYLNDSNSLLLLDVLDKITIMDIQRKVQKNYNPMQKQLVDKYQIIINDMFKEINQNYFAFCALITTDELREKCMEKLKKFDKGE